MIQIESLIVSQRRRNVISARNIAFSATHILSTVSCSAASIAPQLANYGAGGQYFWIPNFPRTQQSSQSKSQVPNTDTSSLEIGTVRVDLELPARVLLHLAGARKLLQRNETAMQLNKYDAE